MHIVGAGLSGLIAAHIWPNAQVFELSPSPLAQHKALLRFRSDIVSQATGIEFKRVKVRKGIWHGGKFVEPAINLANMYSKKCLGAIEPERSIWNIEPAERFIAPDNFYEQLVDNCGSRIHWGVDYQFNDDHCISTIPLPVLLKKLNTESLMTPVFNRSPIIVERYNVPDCNAYQTVYFPSPMHSVYRASITGDMLIVEHSDEPFGNWLEELQEAFHIFYMETLTQVEQKYGKIVPIDDRTRKTLLFGLTHKHNIYSLGRFATWRNILLDDMVGDAAVIKKLMRVNHYDVFKESSL